LLTLLIKFIDMFKLLYIESGKILEAI